jgi:hypothetical protein
VPRTVHHRTVRIVIIECGVCQQPWAVSTNFLGGRGQKFLLPDHPMIDRKTNEPTDVRCSGQMVPGVVMGDRAEWEAQWPLLHSERPRPSVLNGSTSVKIVTD